MIVVFGSITLDMVFSPPRLPQAGETSTTISSILRSLFSQKNPSDKFRLIFLVIITFVMIKKMVYNYYYPLRNSDLTKPQKF